MQRPRLVTRSGVLEGRLEDDVRVFRGVPYAAPPVGPLRWAPPVREPRWSGVRDAGAFGPIAPQRPGALMRMLGMDGTGSDEDCLTLNVWLPAREPEPGGRPVLVWLHGGAFTAGAGSQPVYDGAALARRGDVVVVTLNYRLGALGFLAVSEALAAGRVGANFGLLDQIAALEWVREHAAVLGADPDRVTLFGESAGAMSIGALLAAPAARGRFQRAVLQSGAAHHVSSRAAALRVAERFRAAAGVRGGDLEALRSLPVEAVLDAQQRVLDELGRAEGLPFQPTCEGGGGAAVLPRPPLAAIRDGAARGVSLLVGTNLDEWRVFALADPKLATLDDAGLVRRLLRAPPPGVGAPEAFAAALLDAYRAARGPDAPARELWLAMQADRVFRIPAVRLLEAQGPHAPCFAYLFAWASPALEGALGACHALEVPFVFGATGDARAARLVGDGPEARALSARMQEAWLAFARRGDPGWPRYEIPARCTMRFDRTSAVVCDPLAAERRAWDAMP